MENFEGTRAASRAQMAVCIIGVLALLGGVILILAGLEQWGLMPIGATLLGSGVLLCITSAILKGFKSIVEASETYMEQAKERKSTAQACENKE